MLWEEKCWWWWLSANSCSCWVPPNIVEGAGDRETLQSSSKSFSFFFNRLKSFDVPWISSEQGRGLIFSFLQHSIILRKLRQSLCVALGLGSQTIHIKILPIEIQYLRHMEGKTLGFAYFKQHRKPCSFLLSVLPWLEWLHPAYSCVCFHSFSWSHIWTVA